MGWVPPPCSPTASASRLSAALWSRSRTSPQCGQSWTRSERVLGTSSWHPEQRCEVYAGGTATTTRPALAALYVRTVRNMAPGGVADALGQGVVAHHPRHVEVLQGDQAVAVDHLPRPLVDEVVPAVPDALVDARHHLPAAPRGPASPSPPSPSAVGPSPGPAGRSGRTGGWGCARRCAVVAKWVRPTSRATRSSDAGSGAGATSQETQAYHFPFWRRTVSVFARPGRGRWTTARTRPIFESVTPSSWVRKAPSWGRVKLSYPAPTLEPGVARGLSPFAPGGRRRQNDALDPQSDVLQGLRVHPAQPLVLGFPARAVPDFCS